MESLMDPRSRRHLDTYVMLALVALLAVSGGYVEGQQDRELPVIVTGPRDMVIAPGETAYFNCFARGFDVSWDIVRTSIRNERSYEERGINISSEEFPANTTRGLPWHNITMTVDGRISNNDTGISCTATGHRTGDHVYQEGTLTIAGPPLAPSISYHVHHIENDTFKFILFWNAFTWTGFPIISYTFSLLNESSRQYVISNSTFATQEYNFTTEGKYCALFTLSVSANNSLGRGKESVVRIGNPIVGEIGDIETVVTFYSNGTPHFWMSFLAPKICPGYQTLTYNITVYKSLDNSVIYQFGPTQYIQQSDNERALIVKELRTGLNISEDYEVVVVTESIGSLRSKRKTFDTNMTSSQCTTESNQDSETMVSVTESGGQQKSTIYIAIGTTSAIIVTLLLVVSIQCHVLSRQKRSLRYKNETDGHQLFKMNYQRPRLLESTNPIYEGAGLYEMTPGEFTFTQPTLTLNTGPSDLTHRYVGTPPTLPPPRGDKQQDIMHAHLPLEEISSRTCRQYSEIDTLKAPVAQAEVCSTDGDEYMVMGPQNNGKGKAST